MEPLSAPPRPAQPDDMSVKDYDVAATIQPRRPDFTVLHGLPDYQKQLMRLEQQHKDRLQQGRQACHQSVETQTPHLQADESWALEGYRVQLKLLELRNKTRIELAQISRCDPEPAQAQQQLTPHPATTISASLKENHNAYPLDFRKDNDVAWTAKSRLPRSKESARPSQLTAAFDPKHREEAKQSQIDAFKDIQKIDIETARAQKIESAPNQNHDLESHNQAKADQSHIVDQPAKVPTLGQHIEERKRARRQQQALNNTSLVTANSHLFSTPLISSFGGLDRVLLDSQPDMMADSVPEPTAQRSPHDMNALPNKSDSGFAETMSTERSKVAGERSPHDMNAISKEVIPEYFQTVDRTIPEAKVLRSPHDMNVLTANLVGSQTESPAGERSPTQHKQTHVDTSIFDNEVRPHNLENTGKETSQAKSQRSPHDMNVLPDETALDLPSVVKQKTPGTTLQRSPHDMNAPVVQEAPDGKVSEELCRVELTVKGKSTMAQSLRSEFPLLQTTQSQVLAVHPYFAPASFEYDLLTSVSSDSRPLAKTREPTNAPLEYAQDVPKHQSLRVGGNGVMVDAFKNGKPASAAHFKHLEPRRRPKRGAQSSSTNNKPRNNPISRIRCRATVTAAANTTATTTSQAMAPLPSHNLHALQHAQESQWPLVDGQNISFTDDVALAIKLRMEQKD